MPMPKGMCWRKQEEGNEGIHKSASASSVADIEGQMFVLCIHADEHMSVAGRKKRATGNKFI